MKIDWDPAKATANLHAHGVSFGEAATVLEDDFALTREDPDAQGEQRFVTLGMSAIGAFFKGLCMKKIDAEPYRDINFTEAKQGAVIPLEAGKTKISIRLDNKVIEDFRAQVERAGTGSYQTLINDALVAFIQQRSMIDAVRQVIREELAAPPQQKRRRVQRLESA